MTVAGGGPADLWFISEPLEHFLGLLWRPTLRSTPEHCHKGGSIVPVVRIENRCQCWPVSIHYGG